MAVTEHNNALERTGQSLLDDGIILCIRFTSGDRVVEVCRAAARGGLHVFEITLTTPGALESIRELSNEKDLLVGAGTVLTVDNVSAVADAGGSFALSPVFDSEVVDEATRRGLLSIPGASTPSEILTAHRHGVPMVKVFPAGALGGPDYLRAVRGPLPHIPLIPTSGPTSETIADYIAAGAVAVGVGREVADETFTTEQIESAAKRVRAAMDQARGK